MQIRGDFGYGSDPSSSGKADNLLSVWISSHGTSQRLCLLCYLFCQDKEDCHWIFLTGYPVVPKVQKNLHLGESTFYWYPSSRECTNICCYPLCWCSPTQALRVFSVLNCCTITPKTFFRHQSKFLQPAIESVWKQQQSLLLKSLCMD